MTGAVVARHTVVNKSSAIPIARRASVLADAGAMTIKSAHLASSMCPIPASACSSSNETCTSLPVNACRVSGVINACAPIVIMTRTSKPALINKRANIADL